VCLVYQIETHKPSYWRRLVLTHVIGQDITFCNATAQSLFTKVIWKGYHQVSSGICSSILSALFTLLFIYLWNTQGLVTQDVELLAKESPKPTLSYTGLLNKRGRLINEGFLAPLSESCEDWLLDVHPETGPGRRTLVSVPVYR
jgi:hypothetical protein